jgi:hypothetical protein
LLQASHYKVEVITQAKSDHLQLSSNGFPID